MSRVNKCYNTEDGPIYFSRSVAVVGIVVIVTEEDAYVLLTKRADSMEDSPGRWCLPCGYLDWDETLLEGTIREVLEETTLNLTELARPTFTDIIKIADSTENSKQNVSISRLFCYTYDKLPEINTTSEVSEVEWCILDPLVLEKKNLVFNHFALIEKSVEFLAKNL
jgi:ADP-ribose pyrophosphatase YjhB (NUDIX family)